MKFSKLILIFLMIGFFGLTLWGGKGAYNLIKSETQTFSAINFNSVYEPVFSRVECAVIQPDYQVREDFNSVMKNGEVIEYCSKNNHNIYTNKCRLDLETNTDSDAWFSIKADTIMYVCPIDVSIIESKTDKCRQLNKQTKGIFFNPDEYVVIEGSEFGIGEVDKGEITIIKTADAYGLRTITHNNYLTKTTTCDINRLREQGNSFAIKDYNSEDIDKGILGFNKVIQYISAQSYTINSKNIIDYEGKKVWSIGNNKVCNIAKDIDGNSYVDIQNCVYAPEIICNPASPLCSDDGTQIINLNSEGKKCDEVVGQIIGKVRNINNPNEVCEFECEDDTLKPTKCEEIPKCEKDEWLNIDFECVKTNVPQTLPSKTKESYTPIYLVIIGILGMFAIKKRLNEKKGGIN